MDEKSRELTEQASVASYGLHLVTWSAVRQLSSIGWSEASPLLKRGSHDINTVMIPLVAWLWPAQPCVMMPYAIIAQGCRCYVGVARLHYSSARRSMWEGEIAEKNPCSQLSVIEVYATNSDDNVISECTNISVIFCYSEIRSNVFPGGWFRSWPKLIFSCQRIQSRGS